MPFVAPQTISDAQLCWLRDGTGWKGQAADDQRVIARARRCDPAALELCAGWHNARKLNQVLDSRFGLTLDWRTAPVWLGGRAGWLQASTARVEQPSTAIGAALVVADRSLEFRVAPGQLLQIGPREVPMWTPQIRWLGL